MIQPGSIDQSGIVLEQLVRVEVGMPIAWELMDMQSLLIQLAAGGFTVALVTCRSGWACDITRGDMVAGGEHVREFGSESPATALARAALAAIRQWPQ